MIGGCSLLLKMVKWASLVAQMVKNSHAMQDTWVQSLGRKDPLEEEMAATPVLLPGKSLGQRNLVGDIESMRSQRVGHD